MKNKCMLYIVLQVLKLQSSGVKIATNNVSGQGLLQRTISENGF